MSRPGGLPTPQQSTDIRGKHDTKLAYAEPDFALPESALSSRMSAFSSGTAGRGARSIDERADDMVQPEQLPSPAFSAHSNYERIAKPPAQEIALPPPPSRSRRIIQVKPKPQAGKRIGADKSKNQPIEPASTPIATPAGDSTSNPNGKTDKVGDSSVATAASTAAGATTGSSKKRKASSAATGSRKIARKTAHSLIERRRRSKMNEEYAVLKGLIPACAGQEMHKLSILQAGIEYVRYLHTCIDELREGSQLQSPRPPASIPGSSEGRFFNEEQQQQQKRKPASISSSAASATGSAPVSPSEHASHSPILTESSVSATSPAAYQRLSSSSALRRESQSDQALLPPPSMTTSILHQSSSYSTASPATSPHAAPSISSSASAPSNATYAPLRASSYTTLPSPPRPSIFSASPSQVPLPAAQPAYSQSYIHPHPSLYQHQHPPISSTHPHPSPVMLPHAQQGSTREHAGAAPPALVDEDEAGHALLMLNARDRRAQGASRPTAVDHAIKADCARARDKERDRGIRVSDLLGS